MTEPDQTRAGAQPSQVKPVRFIHTEGKSFHVVHADGVWGMSNGQGNIQLNFLIEHPPIPQSVVYQLNPEGAFSGQITEQYNEIDEKHFLVIREFQVGIVLSLAAAKQAHIVLGNFIALVEDQIRLAQAAAATTRKTP